jgi:3-methyladenine DNA glycosylase AlkD
MVSEAQMDAWVADLDSWDVCDGVCGNLFDRTPFALDKAVEWSSREPEFQKRAAFALMASAAVHRKDLPDAAFASLLPVIRAQAIDERNYVKKAVSWALRQIGKRSSGLNSQAVRTAEQIERIDSRAARWVARDALRELRSDAVQARLRKS